ncbi:hypothetical protein GJ904_19970 [Salmonella enterica]|nr:hypothetical protein [Salmonella enterica subsp. enterica serovar Saintpaul]EEC1303342.1 hypothetical protein [Salmonella enterica]
MKATKLIIALALTAASITSAHAGFIMSAKCPKAGIILVEGDDVNLKITAKGKEYTYTNETSRVAADNGQILTMQSASTDASQEVWRGVAFFSNFQQTRVVGFTGSHNANGEVCRLTEFQTW